MILDTEADSIKQTETSWDSAEPARGSHPKESIRKRGYHRALKRGEFWAVLRKQADDCMKSIIKDLYEDLLKPSPLMQFIKDEK
jgi:hypothetical protein